MYDMKSCEFEIIIKKKKKTRMYASSVHAAVILYDVRRSMLLSFSEDKPRARLGKTPPRRPIVVVVVVVSALQRLVAQRQIRRLKPSSRRRPSRRWLHVFYDFITSGEKKKLFYISFEVVLEFSTLSYLLPPQTRPSDAPCRYTIIYYFYYYYYHVIYKYIDATNGVRHKRDNLNA